MEDETPGSPRKKARITANLDSSMNAITQSVETPMMAPSSDAASYEQLQKEAACGITEFVSPDSLGFSGILKKRYTDFLVNEILPSGQVVHLTNLKPSKDKQEKGRTAESSTSTSKAGDNDPPVKIPSVKATLNADGKDTRNIDTATTIPSTGGSNASRARAPNAHISREETHGILETPAGNVLSSQITNTSGGHQDLMKGRPEQAQADLPAVDSSDPLARHFRDLLPHERTALDHAGGILKPQQPPSPEKSVRSRQQYQIRRTSQGWTGADEADKNEDHDSVAQQLPIEHSVAVSPRAKSENVQFVQDSGTQYSPQASSQSQWQSYAASNRDKADEHQMADEERQTLLSYFSESVVNDILSLYNGMNSLPRRRAREYGQVRSDVIDREQRTKIHQDIRRIFSSRLETRTDDDGCMIISAMPTVSSYNSRKAGDNVDHKTRRQNDRSSKRVPQGKLDWSELGGDFLHFTLYKENKDTMECISWLAKQLKTNPKIFQFAGTKDRRAVTSQRVSVYRVMVNRMIEVGRTLRHAKVGDFQFQPDSLQLGELNGNEFTITLRDCQFSSFQQGVRKSPSDVAREALKNLSERGFLNYYGLQRFGTFSVSTDDVGVKMLQGDFVGAVDAILQFNSDLLSDSEVRGEIRDKTSEDDKARAKAIDYFRTTRKSHKALEMMPRKFSAESAIIRHLGRHGSERDCQGALQAIPRNLRLMYVHAYQSLVWNMAASQRWARFGDAVVEGDLVLIQEHQESESQEVAHEKVDEDGEVIVEPSIDDRATNADDLFVRARHLSREEAQSGKYTIFDIVLPTPGFDILYPANEMVKFYENFMASDRGGGLNPHEMRRSWKEVSLSGSYRKLLARPGPDSSCEVELYDDDDNKQFVETDLDRLNQAKDGKHPAERSQQGKNPPSYPPEPDARDAPQTTSTTVEGDGASDDDQDMDPEGGVPLTNNTQESPTQPQKIAVIIKIQLGSSQYATMALREMMKEGGVRTYKPDYGGGR